jgi:hypothetical protein
MNARSPARRSASPRTRRLALLSGVALLAVLSIAAGPLPGAAATSLSLPSPSGGAIASAPPPVLRAPSGLAVAPGFPSTGALLNASYWPSIARLTVPTLYTNLTINRTDVLDTITAETWGTDVNIDTPLNATASQQFAGANTSYALWPSGDANDQYDYLTNTLYAPNGTTATPKQNASEFAQWCLSVACHAIIGLPGEINDTAFAAGEVSYFVKTLHLTPSFWEIGNEPALWTNYDQRWSQWGHVAAANVTPMQYAILVSEYVKAIHAVDRTAPIVGLPGIGVPGHTGPTWVQDVMSVNGATIAALGLHVYPASGPNDVAGNLTDFDASLTDGGAVGTRLPPTRLAIAAGCAKCDPQVLLTEINSGPVGAIGNTGTYASFMNGFDNVPFVASEVCQSLLNGINSIELYDFKSSYPGAMINESGEPRPLYALYSTLLPKLEPTVVGTTFSGIPGDFFGAATWHNSSTRSVVTLLLANANPFDAVRVGLAELHLPGTTATSWWSYTGSMTRPTLTIGLGVPPPTFTLVPESVSVLEFEY